ncbi:hypothetical protein EJ03DRAFT_373550 [Teratosphaeria nubilosa]|uniref:PLC-like phosphodiesterase n=1 Tax=Teratosphaeria nubilosa TaxID=161662 RepID=A0A6G1LDN3_9PEZI|nr:hypothetical protein EJ03DRAFT_373550 [Teratosphaeria nubilosa]
MFLQMLKTLSLLLIGLRIASASTPCNNSRVLCERAYNNSPFVRDYSTQYSLSGNQYYNSTVQLSAGVRLLSAQVQRNGNALHVCHTSCELLDAGKLTTILLVNGANASANELAAECEAAGNVTDLVYRPPSTNSWINASANISSSSSYAPGPSLGLTQDWPTLQSLIKSGTRLVNFVASLEDNSYATYLLDEFTHVFENDYDVTVPSGFSCEANCPSSVQNKTGLALAEGLMPLMNHFLYELEAFNIEVPNDTYISTTNSDTRGEGNLGSAADDCTKIYGKIPNFVLVDFFNVGPAMDTVDRLNGVTDAVGRIDLSTAVANSSGKPAGVAALAFSHAAMLCSADLAVANVIA